MSTATAAPAIHITRTIRAPRERVFKALIDAEDMFHWRGPASWKVIAAESDGRPGGKYRITMRGIPQGSDQEVTGSAWGEYLDVDPYNLLRYTWLAEWAPGEQTVVTFRLTSEGDATILDLTHDGFVATAAADGHQTGWMLCLAKLEEYLQHSA